MELRGTLRQLVAETLERDPAQIGWDTRFPEMGLTSMDAIIIAARVEELLKTEVDPALLFEYRSINSLAAELEKVR
jgi:acyl carrier protein